MSDFTWVRHAEDKKFYVEPLRAGIRTIPFKDRATAKTVSDALNAAFEAGKKHIQSSIREILDIKEGDSND